MKFRRDFRALAPVNDRARGDGASIIPAIGVIALKKKKRKGEGGGEGSNDSHSRVVPSIGPVRMSLDIDNRQQLRVSHGNSLTRTRRCDEKKL
jgi:hypothetical protein